MDSIKLIFVVLPGLFLVLGLVLAALSLAASLRRKRYMAGWSEASATVTGNLHGKDGPGSNGRDGYAPSYEFDDAAGKRWLGQSGICSQDQAIVGQPITVRYNPANPAESTPPVFFVAPGPAGHRSHSGALWRWSRNNVWLTFLVAVPPLRARSYAEVCASPGCFWQ